MRVIGSVVFRAVGSPGSIIVYGLDYKAKRIARAGLMVPMTKREDIEQNVLEGGAVVTLVDLEQVLNFLKDKK